MFTSINISTHNSFFFCVVYVSDVRLVCKVLPNAFGSDVLSSGVETEVEIDNVPRYSWCFCGAWVVCSA